MERPRVTDREPFKVLVAGGGIAGLEAVMALADLGRDRLETTLVAAEPDFVYKPLLVEEPFTHTPADRLELAPLASTTMAPSGAAITGPTVGEPLASRPDRRHPGAHEA